MIEAPKEIWCETGLYYDFKEDWSEGSWRNYYDNYGDANVKYIRADLAYTRADVESAVLKALHSAASEVYYACGCQDAVYAINPTQFMEVNANE